LPLHGELLAPLTVDRLERVIGVVYRPETERNSHYLASSLARQFDAVLHVDASHALQPLDRPANWPKPGEAQTYPSGK